jgi:hypothetical protein
MTNIKNDQDLKEKLNKHITLPEHVEGKMNEAYQQIRVSSSMENSKVVAYQKPRFRRWMAVVATFTLMIATTVGVLAANGFFSSEATKSVDEEGNDAVIYDYDIDYETTPGVFELVSGYLPEGYQEFEPNKYKRSENEWISARVCSTAVLELEEETKQITGEMIEEKTTIAGMEADILFIPVGDTEYENKMIVLRNPIEGYEVEVFGGPETLLDDLKHFAEAMTITRVGDDTYMTEEEKILMQIKEEEIPAGEGERILEEKGFDGELTR